MITMAYQVSRYSEVRNCTGRWNVSQHLLRGAAFSWHVFSVVPAAHSFYFSIVAAVEQRLITPTVFVYRDTQQSIDNFSDLHSVSKTVKIVFSITLSNFHQFAPNLCQRTTVWNTDAPNCYITRRLFVSDGSPLHHQFDRVRRGLIILRY